jgi:hypothetical protein
MSQSKIDEAFEYMLKLIDEGVEYPDAQWKASSKFAVNGDTLQAMYFDEDEDE